MTDTISIRKKVAALCGFTGDYQEFVFGRLCGINDKLTTRKPLDGSKQYVPVPKYDTCLTAIAQAFDDHKFSYTLSKCISEDTNELLGYFAIGSGQSAFSATAAKAMCYLFIELMEAK